MKQNIDYNLFVQRYLANELDAFELSRFKHLLKSDKWLKAELKLQLAVDEAIADSSLEDLKIYLENLHKKHLGARINKRSFGCNPSIMIAASLLVLIALAAVFIFKSKADSMDQCFNEFYEPYHLSSVKRNQFMNEDVSQLVYYYTNGKFKQAETIIASHEINPDLNRELIMMSAVIYLELDKFNLAEMELNKILTANDTLFKQEALWYLGLNYLKAKKTNKAKETFYSLINQDSYYSKRASDLLERLN